MIIEPDFLDHWKTQMLVQLTGEPTAPQMMLRLWAHCQTRKAWKFSDLSNAALAAICRWSKPPGDLRTFLIDSGFVTEESDEQGTWLVVHDFEITNSSLVRNWTNGRQSGGRPRTHEKPNGNPAVTHAEPSRNPNVSDRVDRSDRVDGLDRSDGLDRGTPLPPKRGKKAKAQPAQLPETQSEPKRGRMLALNAIFNRQPTTAWPAGEVAALEASGLLDLAELDFVDACEAVRSFYHANIPREIEKRLWRRTGLQQLLNDWAGQEDKARAWAKERDRMVGGEAHKLL